MAFGKQTYGSEAEMRESLLSIIKNVSPNEDNYFVSNLGKGSPATNTIHEWNTYYEARPTSVTKSVQGAATSYADLTVESRSNNRTSIIEEPVRVSRTKASIAMVTGEDAYGVEKTRALKRLKAKMEYETLNGAYASGDSGVASGMVGIVGAISTNVTAHASGQSFTETILNDMVQNSYDQVGSTYIADLLVVPIILKRRISTFNTNMTRNINASEKKLGGQVRVYDSEVGQTVMVIAHKDLNAAAGTVTALLLREDCFEHSFLVGTGEPHWEDRAVDGDRKNGTYITEMSLVSYAQRASARRTGFATTL